MLADEILSIIMQMKRSHVFITGKVQGVAFRAWIRHTALSLGLTGWVTNLPDGGVEAVFEGEAGQVEVMERRCAEGPPLARVANTIVRPEAYREEFAGFHILYKR